MANGIISRFRSAVDVFFDRNQTEDYMIDIGTASSMPQFRKYFSMGNERSIIGSIYNRISVDASMISLVHARVDENKNYLETINSGLNRCLSLESNIDQSAKAFIIDAVSTMLEDGSVALVPVTASDDIRKSRYFEIYSMRVGTVIQWYPYHVRVRLYNERTAQKEDITLPKTAVGLIQNPFYSIMNEKNGILRRLVEKLNILDAIDRISGSGKFNLLVQLPYTLKSPARKAQAEERVKIIEDQLEGSQHGIAYTDAAEKVIQLNRPLENNLMTQVEYLTKTLYGQLGISEALLNGTAADSEMVTYQNRVIEPIVAALADELARKFLSETARTQGQTIMYFRDMFNLVTPEKLPDIADKFSRNKIATANELRAVVGWKPSKDPEANKLQNANMPAEKPVDQSLDVTSELTSLKSKKEKIQNGIKPR